RRGSVLSVRRSASAGGSYMFFLFGKVVHDGLHVLVATTGQVDHHQMILGQRGRALEDFGQRVGGLQRRDDAFLAAAQVEGVQRLLVGDRGVLDTTDVMQPGVLGTDTGIVEAGGNRVGIDALAVLVLP